MFQKRHPLPLEVEHFVSDTYELLRPKMALFSSSEEAMEAAIELEKKFRNKIGQDRVS